MKKQPKFIVFEGIDGAGKSTQIRLLGDALAEKGFDVALTAEPTAYESGLHIRKILSGQIKTESKTLAELFALDRANHNTNPDGGISSLMNSEKTVISDRYYYSSMAYQGSQIGLDTVISLNLDNPSIRRPDLCIFLDLDPQTSLSRIGKRNEATEIFENIEYLTKTRQMFFDVIDAMRERGDKIVCVDASRSVEEISKDVLDAALSLWN